MKLPTLPLLSLLTFLSLSAAQAATLNVVIDKMAYAPMRLEAKVGDTVVWTNKDFLAHTTTANGQWDVTLTAGKSGSVTLTKPGAFDYFCRFHPNMKGRIVVAPSRE